MNMITLFNENKMNTSRRIEMNTIKPMKKIKMNASSKRKYVFDHEVYFILHSQQLHYELLCLLSK